MKHTAIKTKPKLPRARVMHAMFLDTPSAFCHPTPTYDTDIVVACIPCRKPSQARALVKVANDPNKGVKEISKKIWEEDFTNNLTWVVESVLKQVGLTGDASP